MGMVAGGAYDEVAERGHSFVGSCAAQVTDGCCEEGAEEARARDEDEGKASNQET